MTRTGHETQIFSTRTISRLVPGLAKFLCVYVCRVAALEVTEFVIFRLILNAIALNGTRQVKYDDLTAWMAKTGEEKGVEGPSTDRKKDEGDSTRLAVSDASLSTKETGSASSAEHGRQADHQKCGEQQQNEGENKPESGSDCSEDLENTEDRHWRTVAVLHLHAHHPITISRVMEDIEAEESMLDEAIALSLEEARRGEAAADVPCFTEVD